MAEPITFRYRAFLSYAHADTRWAKRLHRRLEGFRIDKDLIGRATAQGAVPSTLRPIFRDRDDFTAGHTLTDQTVAALDAAAALIVLCSPASAKSRYVNEEIRLFKSRHPERPVVPVIIDGTPGDAERECFAPALRFEVTTDGAVTDAPDDELAADVRETGDGFDLAVAKVVARLLDLSTDDVFRRAERARRRNANIRNAIIAALALLAVAAMGSAAYAWQQLRTNEAFLNATLKNATDIVNTAVAQATRYNVPRKATLELLTAAEALFDDMARLGRPTPQLRHRKALMLIEFANNYQILGESVNRRARSEEAYRLLSDLSTESPTNSDFQYSLSWACDGLGAVRQDQGNLPEALSLYQHSLEIRQRLAEADPRRISLNQHLALSKANAGSVLLSQGRLTEAFRTYREGLNIVEQLASSNPSNTDLQLTLVVTYFTLGDILYNYGSRPEAQSQENLAVRDRLANAPSGNNEVTVERDHLTEALKSFREGVTLAERLNTTYPNFSPLHEQLYLLHERIGKVLFDKHEFEEALASFRKAAEIAERLVKADPSNALVERNLSIFYREIGQVFEAQDNLDEALKWYTNSLAIRSRLAKTNSNNVQWQRDLSWAHDQLAGVYRATGELSKERDELLAGRAVIQRLADKHPDESRWKDRLAWYEEQLDDVKVSERQRAIDEAAKDNRYDEALKLQEDFARFLEELEFRRDAKVGKATVDALGAVAWRALLARDFTRALQASDRAISLSPASLWLETNRAHALLFLGRVEEARKLYLAHRGDEVGLHKLWDEGIVEDFALLRTAGLAHPLMDELEELFVSKK